MENTKQNYLEYIEMNNQSIQTLEAELAWCEDTLSKINKELEMDLVAEEIDILKRDYTVILQDLEQVKGRIQELAGLNKYYQEALQKL